MFHPYRNVTMPTVLSTRRNVKVRKSNRFEDIMLIMITIVFMSPLLIARWGNVHNYSIYYYILQEK